MRFNEAIRLAQVLADDPSSQVFAAMAGWDFPASRDWLLQADVRDVAVAYAMGDKFVPANRPWPNQARAGRAKPAAQMSQDQIRAALRAAGHTAPFPEEVEAARG